MRTPRGNKSRPIVRPRKVPFRLTSIRGTATKQSSGRYSVHIVGGCEHGGDGGVYTQRSYREALRLLKL